LGSVVCAPPIGISPGGVLSGARVWRLESINTKSFGEAAQSNCVLAPGVLLTLVMRNSNSVPAPDSGLESFEKTDMRSVRIFPAPGRTFAETFQLPLVSPAGCTGVLWKVTTVSSNVRSPWKPIRLSAEFMAVVVTWVVKWVTDRSAVIPGSDRVTPTVGGGTLKSPPVAEDTGSSKKSAKGLTTSP